MASTTAVTMLEQYQISPPDGSVSDASLPLTFFDMMWLYAAPVERIFFYEFPHHSTAHFINAVLPTLKSSLSLTLGHFYPLAGKLTLSPGSSDQFEIRYTHGDAVALTLAECSGVDFQLLAGHGLRDCATLRSLVPCLPDLDDMKPLVAFQMTLFPNQGLSIGVTIHHWACDGSSSMHFIKSWAAACKATLQGFPLPINSFVGGQSLPVYDRALIADPNGLYSAYLDFWRKAMVGTPASASTDATSVMVHATFALEREHVDKLKKLVSDEAKASFHRSTFVLVCAYVWVCLTKARARPLDSDAHFLLAVDCRGRLQPPVPPSYFGNCVGGCLVEAVKVGALIGEDGVVVAAEAIGRAVQQLGDGALRGAEGWLHRYDSLRPKQPITVAGSPRMKVYDTDFGWGRPAKVVVASIEKTGAISLAERRDEPGGVEIGLALAKPEMDEFSSHFSQGLECLA